MTPQSFKGKQAVKGSKVTIQGVSKRFGAFEALKDVHIEIAKGEFFSLLGPSGCGKTTLLRIIGGLEDPESGTVSLDGVNVVPLPPNKRHVNTVFQNYALFPHLTVFENIAFPLRLRKKHSAEIRNRVEEMLDLVKLSGEGRKHPKQLSGGQKQRVAVARALVNEPSVLLLDEPLSALDAKLRQHMLVELDAIHDRIGITFIYVTHDQQEALSVSDRVAVMEAGRVLQIGTPADIYERPAGNFVAQFIGETNLLRGIVADAPASGDVAIETEFGPMRVTTSRALTKGMNVSMTVRPERIMIATEKPRDLAQDANLLYGEVDEIIYAGFQSKYFVKIGADDVFKVYGPHGFAEKGRGAVAWKDRVYLWWSPADGYVVEAHPT
jgi:spermidine/putrescine transport system ATP-binding protein